MAGMYYNHSNALMGERIRLAVGFTDTDTAQAAKEMIDGLLENAQRDVAMLLERGRGIARSLDVAQIYAYYGLGASIDWEPNHTPCLDGGQVLWDVPASFTFEEAQSLLATMGAKIITVHEQPTELWRKAPCPTVVTSVEEGERTDSDRSDSAYSSMLLKRTVH